jgi:hypothetical protein
VTYVSQTARFRFRSYLSAAEALLLVLEDARETEKSYRVTGLSPEAILMDGLVLEGQIEEISEKVAAISGATRSDS